MVESSDVDDEVDEDVDVVAAVVDVVAAPLLSMLCALFCKVSEHAMRVLPQMASRKPIILTVPTDTKASDDAPSAEDMGCPRGGFQPVGRNQR